MRKYYNLLLLLFVSASLQNCDKQNFNLDPEIQKTETRSIDQNEANQVIIRYDEDYPDDIKEILRYKYSNSINFTINHVEISEWDDRLELWQVVENEGEPTINVNDLITNMQTKDFEEGDLEESSNKIVESGYSNDFFIPTQLSNMHSHLQNGPGPIIAIIDSGLDYGQIQGHYLHKIGDPATEQLSGWDFVNDDGDIRDDYGHGTHIAKIIMDELSTDNIHPKFVPLKAFNHEGKTNLFQLLRALSYVNAHEEIEILNMSLGWIGDSSYEILKEIIDEISENTLIICSAGNDGIETEDNDNTHYPSGLNNEDIIAVGGYSTDKFGPNVSGVYVTNIERATWSNYGANKVDFFAPFSGYKLAYANQDKLINLEGTSYSAAFATARAASIKKTGITMSLWRTNIIKTGYKSLSLADMCQSSSAIIRN